MAKYLDPKADLTFKKVFGEHPDLVISFLNAMLPFEGDELITEIEYLPIELVPENPLKKNSIVDVRCKDHRGRVFLVEMQMIWSKEFMQRVLFNASKAYVRQLDVHEDYSLLQPVYSLNLVNEVFEPNLEEYYHYYSMVNIEHTDHVIEGLHLVFVELPKFKPHTMGEKKMQVLWLRYLTEINERTEKVPEELMENPETKRAVDMVRESAFSREQLEGYDKFWDIIRTERTYYNSATRRGYEKGIAQGMEKGMAQGMEKGMAQGMEKGMAQGMEKGLAQGMEKGLAQGMEKGLAQGMEKGMAQGMAQGMEKGRAEGAHEKALETARKLKAMGLSPEQIHLATGLDISEF